MLKELKHKCFKKVKVKISDNTEIEKISNKRNLLKHQNVKDNKEKLHEIEEELANKLSEDLYIIFESETAKINSEEGGLYSGDIWRLKNSLQVYLRNMTKCPIKDFKMKVVKFLENVPDQPSDPGSWPWPQTASRTK